MTDPLKVAVPVDSFRSIAYKYTYGQALLGYMEELLGGWIDANM